MTPATEPADQDAPAHPDSVPTPPSAPLPPMPSLGRIVLVTTHGRLLNGQDEHAAIVTQVFSQTCINVTVFQGSGPPLGYTSVIHNGDPKENRQNDGSLSWRYPPRVA